MRVKPGQRVTVVDNETGKEVTGYIREYTPDSIVIESLVKFDAKKVHFKETIKAKRKTPFFKGYKPSWYLKK